MPDIIYFFFLQQTWYWIVRILEFQNPKRGQKNCFQNITSGESVNWRNHVPVLTLSGSFLFSALDFELGTKKYKTKKQKKMHQLKAVRSYKSEMALIFWRHNKGQIKTRVHGAAVNYSFPSNTDDIQMQMRLCHRQTCPTCTLSSNWKPGFRKGQFSLKTIQ